MPDISMDMLEELFASALELPRDQRQEFLRDRCADNAPLLERLKSLLGAHEQAEYAIDPGLPPPPVADTRAVSEERALEIGRRIAAALGRFEIERVLGIGGMGIVFLARQHSPDRLVAIKIIRPGYADKAALARFKHESQVLGRLHSPGIGLIYEAGTIDTGDGEQPYFVMEYVEGSTLIEYANAHNLSVTDRLKLLCDICGALEHAHQKGVIHRDLKPDNILVTPDGQPKILDFGVARAIDSELRTTTLRTSPGQLIGTIQYMSPEQAAGDSELLDTRADVYALGVIGYELLSGKPPHDLRGKMVHEAIRTIREDEPHRLSSISRVFRGDIENIIARALAKDLPRRYQGAGELAADIQRHLRSEPIVARPPSVTYQLGKFVRRNRAVVGGIGATLGALIIGLIASMNYAAGEARQRIAADISEDAAIDAMRLAEQRSDELAAVVNFQTSILDSIDTVSFGENAVTRLHDMVADALRAGGMESAEVDEALATFDGLTSQISTTDLARALVAEGILHPAAQAAGEQFSDQPLVEADLRRSLGLAYRSLDYFADAEENIVRSVDLRTEHAGETNQNTLSILNNLAIVYANRGEHQKAAELFQKVYDVGRETYGEDNFMALFAANGLALAWQSLGRSDEAEALFIETLALRTQSLGADNNFTLMTKAGLAMLYYPQGRIEEAADIMGGVVEARRSRQSEDPLSYASALANYASILLKSDRSEEGLGMLEESVVLLERLNGTNHSNTLGARGNLAMIYSGLGRFDEADHAAREVLKGFEATLGRIHQSSIISVLTVGQINTDRGDYEAAALDYEDAVARCDEGLEATHPLALHCINQLANALAKSGRADEGLAVSLELNERSGYKNAEHVNTLAAIQHMGGDSIAAVETQRKAIALLEEGDPAEPGYQERLDEYLAGIKPEG